MSDDHSNPYAAPKAEPGVVSTSESQAVRPRRSIVRFTAVAFCGLIGGLAFATGVTVIGCLFYFLLTMNAFDAADVMAANAVGYLGFGGLWLLAAWCFWHRKDLWGILAFLVSILFPPALLWILNMYAALAR